jgi:hypothetical protein
VASANNFATIPKMWEVQRFQWFYRGRFPGFVSVFTIAGAKTDASIQNNSGLTQGRPGLSMAI